MNTEKCFTVIGKGSQWRSHKDGKLFRFNHLKNKEWIYNNPSQEKYGLLTRKKYNPEHAVSIIQNVWTPFNIQ